MEKHKFMYDLPNELMAQYPIYPKHCARMMHVNCATRSFSDYHFYDFDSFLRPQDVVVINDTKVMRAVLRGKRENGALIEIKMVSKKDKNVWDCVVESRKQVKLGEKLFFGDNNELEGEVKERNWCDTGWLIQFYANKNTVEEIMKTIGKLFLPLHLPVQLKDENDYQTVYANYEGSIQPPTAGLHFTDKYLKRLNDKDVNIQKITQHVGRLDNRLSDENIENHLMYEEHYFVTDKTAHEINKAKKSGGRVIAVGTTVTRTLETVTNHVGEVMPGDGWTNLYIYPGYKFKIVDALLSNFQSPGITTLILACAFGETDLIMAAYNEAVKRRYQFLEFGDCIYIEK